MIDLVQTAEYINVLGKFCGKRDIPVLTAAALREKYQIDQADVMVLFGGSILCGGDLLAEAMKNKIAGKYIIVGGAGHTTETLRRKVHERFPDIDTADLPEAEVFDRYINKKYGLQADYLETRSTNCGNNITYLLKLLEDHGVPFKSIILSQDASMQLRMDAGLRKYVSDETSIINYAVYDATVIAENSELVFQDAIDGMWPMERYISLLMGEIPRLRDDADGYGPRGKNFISHVEIPEQVEQAFQALQEKYPSLVREANPLYAS